MVKLSTHVGVVANWRGVRVVLGVAPSLVAVVVAVRVAVAEQRRGQPRPVCAGGLAGGADGLVGLQEGPGGGNLGGHVAVVHNVLEVADLTVDVEVQAR